MASYRYERDIDPRELAPRKERQYTRKEKWTNWWDYNLKWVILIGIAVAFVAYNFIGQYFFVPKPDYNIAVVAPYYLPDDTVTALQTALARYGEDRNGDGEITPLDKTWIGNANPKFTFGMTNNFSWKGLNLNILITGSYGNDIFNASRIETEGMASANNQTTTVLRRWRIPGQQTDVFRSNNPSWNVKNSTYWVEDGSYLKVKNITLSYDITSPKLKRINITRIQPYISLQNFITWTGYSGYDPEVSQSESATQMGIDWGTYPNVRTVVVGLNVTF